MNKRLKCIESHIPDGIGMIDVGTDHGYLPVALARRGYPGAIYASDINEGPLRAARRTAEDAGLSERIRLLLCDGLALCPREEIDSIVIAGMGGDTICGILDRAEWCMDRSYTLILQPMSHPEVLRYWLVYNEFEILEEDLVKDAGTVYPVIVARFGGSSCLSDAELFVGSFDLIRDLPLFDELLDHQIQRHTRALEGISRARNDPNRGKMDLELAVLNGLKEMKTR